MSTSWAIQKPEPKQFADQRHHHCAGRQHVLQDDRRGRQDCHQKDNAYYVHGFSSLSANTHGGPRSRAADLYRKISTRSTQAPPTPAMNENM
jgi:hypothetical protein